MVRCWFFFLLSTSIVLGLPRDSNFNYKEVIRLSLLFYKAQRSGRLNGDMEIPWRGDSALMDKGQNGEDLTGGYYDGIQFNLALYFCNFYVIASDFVKFGFTMAFTTTLLAWGLLVYKDAYEKAGMSPKTVVYRTTHRFLCGRAIRTGGRCDKMV